MTESDDEPLETFQMTNEEIVEWQRQDRLFRESDIGKLFTAFEYATSQYWQHDQSETISDRRLHEYHDKMDTARKAFKERLMSDYKVLA